jgi:hypothetical protein
MDRIKVLSKDVNNIIDKYLLPRYKRIYLKELKSKIFHIKYSFDKAVNDRIIRHVKLKRFKSGWTYVQN